MQQVKERMKQPKVIKGANSDSESMSQTIINQFNEQLFVIFLADQLDDEGLCCSNQNIEEGFLKN